jgi:hypothetical protein
MLLSLWSLRILLQYDSIGQKTRLHCVYIHIYIYIYIYIFECLLSLLVRRIPISASLIFPHTPQNNRGLYPIVGWAFLFLFDTRPCRVLSTILLQMFPSHDHPWRLWPPRAGKRWQYFGNELSSHNHGQYKIVRSTCETIHLSNYFLFDSCNPSWHNKSGKLVHGDTGQFRSNFASWRRSSTARMTSYVESFLTLVYCGYSESISFAKISDQ